MNLKLVYMCLIALAASLVNYAVIRRNGYTSYTYIILGFIAFLGLGMLILKLIAV